MKAVFCLAPAIVLMMVSCHKKQSAIEKSSGKDSLTLVKMISEREEAMIKKDMDLAMSQFTEDATWINSQGYFFEGKSEVKKFHDMLSENDSLDYYYEAGKPKVRILDPNNALAYYSWKMFWFRKQNAADTLIREIGLMTLHAQKQNEKWKWMAVTNQHTPWFYDEIKPEKIE